MEAFPGRTADMGIGDGSVPLHAHATHFWETDKEFADGVGFLEAGLRGRNHCVILGYEKANRGIATTLAGWINRHQQHILEHLVEENRVLKEQLKAP